MKNHKLYWMLIPCFAFLLACSFPTSAYASTHVSTDTGVGGGCNAEKITQGSTTSFAQYAACISYSRVDNNLYPDAYFNFGAQSAALWTSCTITIGVQNVATGQILENPSFDCLNSARSDANNTHYAAHYIGSQGDGNSYATRVCWTGIYEGKVITGLCLFSPTEFVNVG
jgi:hypothetical protein